MTRVGMLTALDAVCVEISLKLTVAQPNSVACPLALPALITAAVLAPAHDHGRWPGDHVPRWRGLGVLGM